MKKTKLKEEKKTEKSYFPMSILTPLVTAFNDNLKLLQKRKEELTEEDPFSNSNRTEENASPDTDAEEQFSHAKSSAIRTEIDRKIIQTRKALSRIKIGKYGVCESCNNMIDTDRLIVYPEAEYCAKCQSERE